MAYTKQNWECGDLITADKMNHIEDGLEAASSGGGAEPLFVGMQTVDDDAVLDKTWQEIYDAMNANRSAYLVSRQTGTDYGIATMPIISTEFSGSMYRVTCLIPGGSGNVFCTPQANGYPTYNGCQVS